MDNLIDLSLKLSDSDHKISNRSRNSVLKGAPCFIWDKGLQRTTESYFNKNFKEGFNKPPNEVNFLKGLGPNKGNLRNKVHIQRVTRVQEIFHMKTSNRSLKTFTEDPRTVNCYVKKEQKLSSNAYMKFPTVNIKEDLKNICTKVILADNIDTRSPSEESDLFIDKNAASRKILNKQEIQEKLNVNKRLLDRMSSTNNLNNNEDCSSFREWALKEREKFKLRTLTDILKKEKRRLDSESDSATSSISSSSKSSFTTNTMTSLDENVKDKDSISHLHKRRRRRKMIPNIRGYMYGKFTKIPKPDKMMKNQDKFGIPNSMIERAEKIHEQIRIDKRQQRHERLKHMNMPMFNSNYEDLSRDNDDDVFEDVKTLSLVRTPYFLMPKIKTKKCKRGERLRSKFLKDDRLRRITMLLFDRSLNQDLELTKEQNGRKEEHEKVAIASKGTPSRQPTITGAQTILDVDQQSEFRQGYKQFMRDKYQEHKHKIEEENIKLVTFKEFKQTEQEEQNIEYPLNESKAMDSQFLLNKDIRRYNQLQADSTGGNNNHYNTCQEDHHLQLKRKLNYKLSRYDEYVGPFYIDPELCEKFRQPKKCMLLQNIILTLNT